MEFFFSSLLSRKASGQKVVISCVEIQANETQIIGIWQWDKVLSSNLTQPEWSSLDGSPSQSLFKHPSSTHGRKRCLKPKDPHNTEVPASPDFFICYLLPTIYALPRLQ